MSGLRYGRSQPAGRFRITSVEVKNADGSFSPIDPAATYKLASNDFMRNGGDGYEAFVNAHNAYDFGPSLDEAVQEYIKTLSQSSRKWKAGLLKVTRPLLPRLLQAETTFLPAVAAPRITWCKPMTG